MRNSADMVEMSVCEQDGLRFEIRLAAKLDYSFGFAPGIDDPRLSPDVEY